MRVEGVRLSLWRAAALYRVVTLVFADYLIFWRWHSLYARPWVAFVAGATMIVVTALVAWLAVQGRAHRRSLVAVDVVVTIALTLLTIAAQTHKQSHGDMPTLTTLWAAGPTLEAAILGGWIAGLVAAALQMASTVVVHDGYDGRTIVSGLILLISGTVVGYVTTLVTRSEAELAAAVSARAALAERERLARSVHDGVLQVLGLVHRAGRDEPGEWGRLAREAAEQESQLRALITSRSEAVDTVDLVAALRALRTDRVTVATPASAPQLPDHVGAELVAAVRAALSNVRHHAGDGARAWVLLEELDDAVAVTVRDDGVGFDAVRLAEAEREGRLGVASSLRARVSELGGTVSISSTLGEGTLVEIEVPLAG